MIKIVKRKMSLVGLVILVLGLAACGSDTENVGSGGESSTGSAISDSAGSGTAAKVRLTDDYADALPVQTQLAIGTLQLEETDWLVDETLAAEILPLWRAVQSLGNSETAAEAEVNAVINQIQDTMSSEQVTAIADMKLTEEGLVAMIEGGELQFARGGGGFGGQGGGQGGGGFGGGNFIPGGGGPGGGGFGGPGRGGFGNLSEEDIATRQAQFAEGGFAAFRGRAMTGAVIRLLETKTGEAPEGGPGRFFGSVFDIVSEETGLTVEEIQAQTTEGVTLAEIIEANGGYLETVKTALTEVFSNFQGLDDQDIEQRVEAILNGNFAQPADEQE
jgi:hypothetical protein